MSKYGFAAVMIGFASMVAQLTFLREFLNIFYGNELVFGLALGAWMALVGLGSHTAAKVKVKDSRTAFAFTLAFGALLIPASVYVSNTVDSVLTVRGEMAGLAHILGSLALTLGPYCMLYGVQITLVCAIIAEDRKAEGIGWGYILDSAGDILGGLAFTFLLVNLLDSFQTAYVAGLASAAGLYSIGGRWRIGSAIICLMIVSFAFAVDLQDVTDSIRFQGEHVLEQVNTRYGNLVVSESSGQVNFYENNLPLFSTGDVVSAEETVHYPMSQRDKADNVLLISGGVSGTLKEILKYDVSQVDYVELDPEIIRLAREYLGETGVEDPRVNVHNMDGRIYVKTSPIMYDVVIVDLPDPTTAQLNRFYTLEFYSEVKRILSPGGVFSTGVSGSENYMNEEVRMLNAGVYATLTEAFAEVLALPGGRNIYLASDSGLETGIGRLVGDSGVETHYVNENYLVGTLNDERISYLEENIASGGELNRDLKPTAYYHHLRYWMTYFNMRGYLPHFAVAFGLAAAILYFRLEPLKANIMGVGFTGTALEVVLLISFQALYGFVYHQVGLIVTSFMVGLAWGAHRANRKLGGERRRLTRMIAAATAYPLVLAAVIMSLNTVKAAPMAQFSAQVIFPLITAALGSIVGSVFPLAARANKGQQTPGETAGTLYSLDFLGAFIGCMLVSVFLIPAVGILTVCALVCAVNVLGYLRLTSGK
ncbi:MAG: hypothetical protein GF416_08945 [Candidatus Altiarchaeales archaeon]|nr:hypothetical protein [Candidatus Altiarchaeales archaeon]MBD3417244.1 hypothetical protein [Candidatus Altiarchaeales archaeon]